MTHRERYIHTLLGKDVDRVPLQACAWGPWGTTWERWKREGMHCENWGQVCELLDDDVNKVGLPVHAGPFPALGHVTIEETDEFTIYLDTWGIKRRNFKNAESMSEFLEFPVKNRDDWEKYKKNHLDPHAPGRLETTWRRVAAEAMAKGQAVRLGSFPDVCIFGALRWLMGDEECLLAFYTDPELVHDIMNHMTDVYVEVLGKVASEARVDELHIWEDMSGRQGSLISPQHWEEFMGPCYRRLKAMAERCHIPIISVDTDGNPDTILPPMIRNGVNNWFPLEVQASCDINDFQARYPTLSFCGGIDKRALAQGPDAIDAELARIAPAIPKGRYIPTLDHLIPDDVSWENFQYFARAMKRMIVGK